MDYLSILKEASNIMFNNVWDTYDRFRDKLDADELGHKVDIASADSLKSLLERDHLHLEVISEEGFEDYKGNEKPILIVDPVDGTSNFSRNIPFSSISLALSWDDDIDKIFVGVVKDLFRKDIYWAVKGKGAYINNSKIHVSNVKSTINAHFSININRAFPGKSTCLNLLPYIPYARHFGSAALEGCFVASGRLDAYIDIRDMLRIFDIAASQFIVREACGKILLKQYGGDKIKPSKVGGISIIAASTNHLLERITDLLLGF